MYLIVCGVVDSVVDGGGYVGLVGVDCWKGDVLFCGGLD